MQIRFSDQEAAILLGATWMHEAVPFRMVPRRELTEPQQAVVDEASAKLIGLRETYQRRRDESLPEVELSDQEIALLIAVVEDCLNECGSDSIELSLQLHTSDRQEVELLVERLRASLAAADARLV